MNLSAKTGSFDDGSEMVGTNILCMGPESGGTNAEF